MSSYPEMSVFNLRINQGLLDCTYCGKPLRPDTFGGKPMKCASLHIFCFNCVTTHRGKCVSRCCWLDRVVKKMKFKCSCCDSTYIQYGNMERHRCDMERDRRDIDVLVHHKSAVIDYSECIIDTSALVCSECRRPLRPPIFRHRELHIPDVICGVCYRGGDFAGFYLHSQDLDYLVEGISVECVACKKYVPFSTLASHQLDDCSFKQTLPEIAPGRPPQCPPMSSSPETSVFNLKISQGLLDCTFCHRAFKHDTFHRSRAMRCAGGHIFCYKCDIRHSRTCISRCGMMDEFIIQMKFKSNCCDSGRKYTPCCEFAGQLCTTHPHYLVEQQLKSDRAWKECILNTSALLCFECRLPLRRPIFRHLLGYMLVCDACYHLGDTANYRHCQELDYLVEGILVECAACKEYLPFPTLASHQLDNCSFKQMLLKTGPGSMARKNVYDEEKTERSSVGSKSIHGKNKQMAPLEVGKMDKHIVHSNDSCDDNHGTSEHVFSCEDDSIDKMDEGEEVENEMGVLNIRINPRLLDCKHCRRRLDCKQCHQRLPLLPANTHCFFLDRIIHQMRFKCNFCHSGYIPYSKFLVHLCDATPAHVNSIFSRGECILATSALVCSECGLPLQPPIFKCLPRETPICSACCRNGDLTSYRHSRELERLIQGITVKSKSCKQYLPFSTFASRKLDNLCDEEGSGRLGRPTACNSSIHGENRQKAPYEVGDEVGNDDGSSSDNHDMSEDVFTSEESDDYSVEEGEEIKKPRLPRSHLCKRKAHPPLQEEGLRPVSLAGRSDK